MFVDTVEALKKTSSLLVPTSTSTHSHSPLPTIIPELPEYRHLHEKGMRTLWVVFVVMLIASAAFTAMSWTVPVSKRLYHVITSLITIISTLSYFAMATGQGWFYHHARVKESHRHVPDTYNDVYRQVYWARYVDWSLTTPLILLDLSLLAGLNGAHILMAVIADVIMFLAGLFAALGSESTPQKWGWYAISCIAYLVVIWHLAVHGRAEATSRSGHVGRFFNAITTFTLIVWTAYPIVWGFALGSRHMSVDAQIITYAVLDILLKPVFGAWLLMTHRKTPETHIELGGFWSNGLGKEGQVRLRDEDGA